MNINSNEIQFRLIRLVAPIVGCISAAIATIYIIQEVNPLAAACLCASAIFFGMAVVAPRAGIVLLLLLCAYSDIVKRMLVFWGDLSYEQISYVLAAAPVVVIGLFVAIITRWAFHQAVLHLRDTLLFVAVFLSILVNIVIAKIAGEDLLGAMKAAANNGLYLLLAPVMLKLVRQSEDVDYYILKARWIFVPVALYGIWQSVFGLADFEFEYLRSGLTIMVKELWDLRPRPFSTLNSAGSLGTVCAAFSVLSLYPLLVNRKTSISLNQKLASIGCSILFFAGFVVSLVRSSIVVWIVSVLAYWCFRSARRTQLFYWGASLSFATLLIFSPYFLEKLADWDPSQYVSSDVATQALRIQTYSDRLKGFVNLTRSTDMYSAFGLPESKKDMETTYFHDPISSLVVNVGVVGFLAAVIPFIVVLRILHQRVLKLTPGPERNSVVLLIAINTGWLACHILFNGVITVFPVNAFFWMFGGMAGALLLEEQSAEAESVSSEPTTPRWSRIGTQRQTANRSEQRHLKRP
jgi:hypothetical protein